MTSVISRWSRTAVERYSGPCIIFRSKPTDAEVGRTCQRIWPLLYLDKLVSFMITTNVYIGTVIVRKCVFYKISLHNITCMTIYSNYWVILLSNMTTVCYIPTYDIAVSASILYIKDISSTQSYSCPMYRNIKYAFANYSTFIHSYIHIHTVK